MVMHMADLFLCCFCYAFSEVYFLFGFCRQPYVHGSRLFQFSGSNELHLYADMRRWRAYVDVGCHFVCVFFPNGTPFGLFLVTPG